MVVYGWLRLHNDAAADEKVLRLPTRLLTLDWDVLRSQGISHPYCLPNVYKAAGGSSKIAPCGLVVYDGNVRISRETARVLWKGSSHGSGRSISCCVLILKL